MNSFEYCIRAQTYICKLDEKWWFLFRFSKVEFRMSNYMKFRKSYIFQVKHNHFNYIFSWFSSSIKHRLLNWIFLDIMQKRPHNQLNKRNFRKRNFSAFPNVCGKRSSIPSSCKSASLDFFAWCHFHFLFSHIFFTYFNHLAEKYPVNMSSHFWLYRWM